MYPVDLSEEDTQLFRWISRKKGDFAKEEKLFPKMQLKKKILVFGK